MPENPLEGRSPLALELRRLRIRAALSQSDLSLLLKRSANANTIYRQELGKNTPTEGSLRKLARVLNCDVAPLLILRNAELAKRRHEKLTRKSGIVNVNYRDERHPNVEAEWMMYQRWVGYRPARVSFVAGWNAALATDNSLLFNG